MAELFLLDNPIKNYDWGSKEAIAKFLGRAPSGLAEAELWMGAHPQSPSCIHLPNGKDRAKKEIGLNKYIAKKPKKILGKKDARDFGSLPFLFKILAAGKPLSLQVHPSLAEAKAGWERENSAGIALNAPERQYKDKNHKPEILVAETPFTAMAGFRGKKEILDIISALKFPELEPLVLALEPLGESAALKYTIDYFFNMEAEKKKSLLARLEMAFKTDPVGAADEAFKALLKLKEGALIISTIRLLWENYKDDLGVFAPIYLNVLELAPGEGIFVDAGILHSYVSGLGMELMANSDNVIRAGLSSKHLDYKELSSVLRFEAQRPAIMSPNEGAKTERARSGGVYRYPSKVREFSLEVLRLKTGPSLGLPLDRARILFVAEGEANLRVGRKSLALKRGEAAFIGVNKKVLFISGEGRLYSAQSGP